MPYSKSKLPKNLPKDFTDKQVKTFISTANSALSEGKEEGAAIAIGISSAKKVEKGYKSKDKKSESIYKQSASSTPAKPSERRRGSDKNKSESASTASGSVKFSEGVTQSLQNKVKEHNKRSSKKVTLGQLKAVYRRGAGAFSTSHRPNMTRGQWAMARVNSFLKRVKRSGGHTQDDDLIRKADSSGVTRDSNGNIVYRGAKFAGFNKPRPSNRKGKDGMVLAKKGDQIKLIHFGDANMRHNYSAEANDAYYARFGSNNDKFSAMYWSHRYLWPKGELKGKGGKPFVPLKKSYEDIPEEDIVKEYSHEVTSYVNPVEEKDLPLGDYEDVTEEEDVVTSILKFNEEEMVAIEPLAPLPMHSDKHGEGMTKETVEKLIDSINEHIDVIKPNIGHIINTQGYHFVKAWINPCDCIIGSEYVPEGQPIMKVQFTDEKLWKMRKEGRLMGLSIGAVGKRAPNPNYEGEE